MTAGYPCRFTSFSATTGGIIRNEVQRDFNGFGQMTAEYQSHSQHLQHAQVQYSYSNDAKSRLISMTYPNGCILHYEYDMEGGVDLAEKECIMNNAPGIFPRAVSQCSLTRVG